MFHVFCSKNKGIACAPIIIKIKYMKYTIQITEFQIFTNTYY